MHLRRLAVTALAAVTVLAACGGDDEPETLSEAGFVSRVTAAVAEDTDLVAEPIGNGKIRVTGEGPDRLEVSLAEAYERYQRSPGDEEEIVGGVVRETAARLERGLGGEAYEEVRAHLLPVVERRTDLRRFPAVPASTDLPAGLAATYVVDRDGHYALVTAADAERWGLPLAELHEQALANLERQTNEDEPLLCEPADGGKLCGWASGDGYDAARLLVPELRAQIRRELGGPAVYAVPESFVFVALPRRLADRIRAKVLRDFTVAEDPVSPELFVERGGRLVVLE